MVDPAPPALFGRADELAALSTLLSDRSRPGRLRVGVVRGEPGIGKTSLVRAVAAAAPGRVLSAAATAIERHRPFGLLVDCLGIGPRAGSGLARQVAALLQQQEAALTGTGGLEHPVGETILALVEDLCGDRPLLLVLEDLHWADAASLVLVHRLSRATARLPLTLLCTARSALPRDDLGQLVEGLVTQGAVDVTLGPLPAESVAELVESLLGVAPAGELLTRLEVADGNPLFVRELVIALRDGDSLRRDEQGAATLEPDEPVPALSATVLNRLAHLDADTRDLLSLASVLGTDFSLADLLVLTDRPLAALTGPVRTSLAAGLLVENGQQLSFRHDLVRAALHDSLPAAMRAALHGEAARRMADSGAAAQQVAEHLLLAKTSARETVEWLHRAALQAAPHAPAVAADLWLRALQLLAEDDERVPMLQAERAVALLATGKHTAGAEQARAALSGGVPPPHEFGLRFALAQSLLAQGRGDEAEDEADNAARSPAITAAEQARLAAWRSFTPIYRADFDAALQAATEAEPAARATGDAEALVRVLVTHANVHTFRGSWAQAERYAREAVFIAEESGSRRVFVSVPHLLHGLVLVDLDRPAEAADVFHRGRRTAEAFGGRHEVCVAHAACSYAPYWSGQWDDAVVEVETSLALAEETGSGWQAEVLCLRGHIALARNGPDSALRWVEAAEAELAQGRPGYRLGWTEHLRARFLLASGQPERAWAVLGPVWGVVVALGAAIEYRVLGLDVVQLALAAGDLETAQQAAAVLAQVSAANPDLTSLAGVAAHARGLVDDDPDVLLAALSALQESPRTGERARCAHDTALALARAGRSRHARTVAEEALGLYAALGASADADLARSAYRAVDLRLGVRGARARPATGWEALTDTEMRVAALVAEGLSNPEVGERMFLSRRTVGSHVSHILAKLGVRSRSEIAALVARRAGGAAPPR